MRGSRHPHGERSFHRVADLTGNVAPLLFIDAFAAEDSHRSRFKVADFVIFDGITHFDWLAAHFAVFHIGLSLTEVSSTTEILSPQYGHTKKYSIESGYSVLVH